MTTPARARYTGYRFPAEIIGHAVWLYFRFPLGLRMVEELLAARGIIVSHETVRQWARKFGQQFANQIRRRLPRVGDKWHLARAAHEGTQRPPHRVRCDSCGNRQRSRDRDEARPSDGERLHRAGEHLATGLKPALRIARRRPTAVELPPRCLGGPRQIPWLPVHDRLVY